MTERLYIEAQRILDSDDIQRIGTLVRLDPAEDVRNLCRDKLQERISEGTWYHEDSEALGDFDEVDHIRNDMMISTKDKCVECKQFGCHFMFKRCEHPVCSSCKCVIFE